MGFNSNYFKTLSGGLKVLQLNFNIIIICIISLGWRSYYITQPLLQLSITNVIFCVLIMIIRVMHNPQNTNSGLAKLEFGMYSISTYLYVHFSIQLISIAGFKEYNVAMIFGLLSSVLYASDAFDKFTKCCMCGDNKSTSQYARYPAQIQNEPPPVYPAQGY
nr:uncharacterized protein LOC111413256 [Onthophagus taurus]